MSDKQVRIDRKCPKCGEKHLKVYTEYGEHHCLNWNCEHSWSTYLKQASEKASNCILDNVSLESLKAHLEKQIDAARKLTKFNNNIGNIAQERKEQGKYLAYKDIIDGINNGAFKD